MFVTDTRLSQNKFTQIYCSHFCKFKYIIAANEVKMQSHLIHQGRQNITKFDSG